jgi:hypothetical protein
VKPLLDFVGMSVGGWLGWMAGAPFSTFVAFVVSVLGTGVGLWATRRYVTRNLP